MMILDAYGAFLAEAGPQQESIAVLQLAVQQQPNEGFEKYMYAMLDSCMCMVASSTELCPSTV